MRNELSTLPSLNEQLLAETIEKIRNDMEAYGLEIIVPINDANVYQTLCNQLSPFIANLLNTDRAKLMRILYKIDISEPKLKQTQRQYAKVSLEAIITHLIIEREAQKVMTKRYFASKSSNENS